jgi:DedD protein
LNYFAANTVACSLAEKNTMFEWFDAERRFGRALRRDPSPLLMCAEVDDLAVLKRQGRRRLAAAVALALGAFAFLPLIVGKAPADTSGELRAPAPLAGPAGVSNASEPAASAVDTSQKSAAISESQNDAVAGATLPQRAAKRAVSQNASGGSSSPSDLSAMSNPAASSEIPSKTYVVPLGAYASPRNARRVMSRVANAGFKTYSEPIIDKNNPRRLRVRAGPFASAEDASQARKKLKSLGLSVGSISLKRSNA